MLGMAMLLASTYYQHWWQAWTESLIQGQREGALTTTLQLSRDKQRCRLLMDKAPSRHTDALIQHQNQTLLHACIAGRALPEVGPTDINRITSSENVTDRRRKDHLCSDIEPVATTHSSINAEPDVVGHIMFLHFHYGIQGVL